LSYHPNKYQSAYLTATTTKSNLNKNKCQMNTNKKKATYFLKSNNQIRRNNYSYLIITKKNQLMSKNQIPHTTKNYQHLKIN